MSTDLSPAVNGRPRTAKIIIVSIGGGILALLLVVALLLWPRPPAVGAAADMPIPTSDEYHAMSTGALDVAETDVVWTEMNAAMEAGDRDAFLARASGDALAFLGRWWDNTKAIGWDVAVITPADSYDDDTDRTILLGAEFSFAPSQARGNGNPDAGLHQVQGGYYSITLSSTDAEATIAAIEPLYQPQPWDEGTLHVVKRDHVVVFGHADEASTVDRFVDEAEGAAVTAFDTLKKIGGEAALTGFVTVITGDAARQQRWEYGTAVPDAIDVAGFHSSMYRPPQQEPWLRGDVATGSDITSGSYILLGTLGFDSARATLVHEYAHALHTAAAPSLADYKPIAVMEGFAEYFEWTAGVSEARFTDPRISSVIADEGFDAFSDYRLRAEDAFIGYYSAGSYYAFLAERGAPIWDLALTWRAGGTGMLEMGSTDPKYSEAEWQAWVRNQS